MTPEERLRQNAIHEAGHAVVGFDTGLRFLDEGIWVLADPLTQGRPVGAVGFFQPDEYPAQWIVALLAGPMYERLSPKGSDEVIAQLITALNDGRNTAYGLHLWLKSRRLTADLPLLEMVFDSATSRLRDWTEMGKHLDSPEWKPRFDFHRQFFDSLLCLQACIPDLENGCEVNAIALLRWFAGQTRQILEKQRSAIEALATELLTETRLKGNRYVMSGPDLESFLTIMAALDEHQITQREYEHLKSV